MRPLDRLASSAPRPQGDQHRSRPQSALETALGLLDPSEDPRQGLLGGAEHRRLNGRTIIGAGRAWAV